MINSRISVLRGGVELALLMTLVWFFCPIVVPHHVVMNEVGMCIGTADHSLRLKAIGFQEDSKTRNLTVEESSSSRRMLVVLLEGTGSSNSEGLYYLNWHGKLHVWSWKPVNHC